MGTNTFLCLIAEVSGDGQTPLRALADHAKVVRLGEKVNQNRFFLAEALGRAKACLTEFRTQIDLHNVDKVIATATSAARDVSNSGELKKICSDLQIPLHIIEGTREAKLSFAGAVSALPQNKNSRILVIDIGGGSTEYIFQDPGKPLKAISYDVGSVRLTEMFIESDPPSKAELSKLRNYAEKIVSDYGKINPDLVIAVAGTPTTLACIDQNIDFNEDKVEGYQLDGKKLAALTNRLSQMTLDQRKKVRGLDPLRADVIIAGAVLLDLSLKLSGAPSLRVSTRGLRYGVATHHGEFT